MPQNQALPVATRRRGQGLEDRLRFSPNNPRPARAGNKLCIPGYHMCCELTHAKYGERAARGGDAEVVTLSKTLLFSCFLVIFGHFGANRKNRVFPRVLFCKK